MTIVSLSSSYLTAEAKINAISTIVLLDTGSGLTIINARYWSILSNPSSSFLPYDGADIHGADGNSIHPIARVTIQVAIAGVSCEHPAILAQTFEHCILLGNDFMKVIGLVLDIQANTMWLRHRPHLKYAISSDLSHAGQVNIPLLSTESRTIPQFHLAFIQVQTPPHLTSQPWDASVVSATRHVLAANALVRIVDRCCLIQIANCSSKSRMIHQGQSLAIADFYDLDSISLSTFPPSLLLAIAPSRSNTSLTPAIEHSTITDSVSPIASLSTTHQLFSHSIVLDNSSDNLSSELTHSSSSLFSIAPSFLEIHSTVSSIFPHRSSLPVVLPISERCHY